MRKETIETGSRVVSERETRERFMRQAIALGQTGSEVGEVPVGALLVMEGEVIAASHNGKEGSADPTAHAEILVLQAAARQLGRWRLTGATLYVTLEPCAMCAGALVQARVSRLVFGAHDPKAGGCGSVFDIVRDPRLNHQVEVISGILQNDVQALFQHFFEGLRQRPTERWPSPV